MAVAPLLVLLFAFAFGPLLAAVYLTVVLNSRR